MDWLGLREVFLPALYTVRVSRIGPFAVPFFITITV